MKKTIIGTIALLIITFVLLQSCSVDFVSSIIPGWHATIINISAISALSYIWIGITIAAYFILYKKKVINTKLMVVHILFTIPLPIISIVIANAVINHNNLFVITDLLKFRLLGMLLFFIGQIIFIYHLVIIYRKKRI